MNPLDLFNGQVPLTRVYLQPTTSQNTIPKGMKNVDKYLMERKSLENNKENKKN